MSRRTLTTLLWVSIFAVAMGFLESSVVVYLRKLYYPGGFNFPLKPLDPDILFTEVLREAATVVMLAGAAVLAGRTNTARFAFFIYAFAVWDLFYYVFLAGLLGWPSSLLTWDLLFMIPVPWVGPVLAPAINSLAMITLAWIIISATDREPATRLKGAEWGLLVLGSLVVIISYTWDYLRYMLQFFSLSELWSYRQHPGVTDRSAQYVPVHFNWLVFIAGQAVILAGMAKLYLRTRKFITLPRNS